MGWPSKLSLKPPVARLNTTMTTNRPAMGSIRSKSRMRKMLRTEPAKQMRTFCARAPITRAVTRAMSTGACLEPGPAWLTANTPAKTLMHRPMISSAGRTAPAVLFVSCSRPKE